MNERNIIHLKNTYDVDIIKDVMLKDDHHITFFMDFSAQQKTIQIISGDPTTIGLPNQAQFTTEAFKSYIETNNALSEVEGRESFIEDLRKKIHKMKKDLQVHIPIKRPDKNPLWLLVGLECIKRKKGKVALLTGRVNQIYEQTPDAIIHYQKTYQDALTTLFTRESLKKHMNYLEDFQGTYGMYLDLDNFKEINETLGHHQGDWFLKRLAQHFIDLWEENVLYYRLGGDEFFVYVFNFSQEEVFKRAQTIIEAIVTIAKNELNINVSASIGVVAINKDNKDFNKLLDESDMAMYFSKQRGNGNVTLLKGDALHYYDDQGNFTIKPRKVLNPKIGNMNDYEDTH